LTSSVTQFPSEFEAVKNHKSTQNIYIAIKNCSTQTVAKLLEIKYVADQIKPRIARVQKRSWHRNFKTN